MIGFGAIALVVDWRVGLPWHWTTFEGPVVIAFGAVILWLSKPTPQQALPVTSPGHAGSSTEEIGALRQSCSQPARTTVTSEAETS